MNKECMNELKNILKEYENDEEVIKWINNFLKNDFNKLMFFFFKMQLLCPCWGFSPK